MTDKISKRGRVNEGRPVEFEPWMVPVARKLYELGATDADVAEAIGKARITVLAWHDSFPEFADTKKAKELPDAEVERSLFKRALGYTTEDGTHIPAHPTAQIFWLKNRQKAKWRDRQEIEHSGVLDGSRPDPEAIADQLVTMATANPTLAPVIRTWAERLILRLPLSST